MGTKEPRTDLASLGTFTSCPEGRPCPCASACRATSRPCQPCPARLWSVSVAPSLLWRTPSSAAPGPRPSYPRRRSWRRRLPWPFPWLSLPSSSSRFVLHSRNVRRMERSRRLHPGPTAPALRLVNPMSYNSLDVVVRRLIPSVHRDLRSSLIGRNSSYEKFVFVRYTLFKEPSNRGFRRALGRNNPSSR